MGRIRKGSIVEREGKLYAVIQYVDETGRKRGIWRRAQDRKDARGIIKQVLRDLDDRGEAAVDAQNMPFAELAAHFEQHYLKAAEYTAEGRKVAGYRSFSHTQDFIKPLRAAFDRKRLRSITYGDIRAYKLNRLKTETQYKRPRSLASVHRELALLRRMLNIAVRESWLLKNPFTAGEPLISLADERRRERILTRDEEARLLEACGERTVTYKRRGKEVKMKDRGRRREHLRPLIIMAIDTGCRRGEMLSLQWRSVDFENGLITLHAMNTKTMRERQVAITSRLRVELERMWKASPKDLAAPVFGIDSVKRAFKTAREAAEIDGVRFHDLRHTHASRLDELGFSLSKIGAQLGHTQVQTTARYVNRDRAGVQQVAAALDAFNTACPRPGGLIVEAVHSIN
jgi:integrase